MLAFLIVVLFQALEPTPGIVELGCSVRVVFADAAAAPIVAALILATTPTGETRPLGSTDAAGAFEFTPDRPGTWRLAAARGDVECVVPLAVVEPPPRVLLGVVGVLFALTIASILRSRARFRSRAHDPRAA